MPSPRERAYPIETREFCKTLWLQGVKTAQIAEKTGVPVLLVRNWMCRYNWKDLLLKTKQALQLTGGKTVPEQVAEQSLAAKSRFSSDILEAAEKLPKHRRDLDGFSRRASAVKTLVDTAAVVYGWSSSTPTPQVNIALLSSGNAPTVVSTSEPLAVPEGLPNQIALGEGDASASNRRSPEPGDSPLDKKEFLSTQDASTPTDEPTPPSDA